MAAPVAATAVKAAAGRAGGSRAAAGAAGAGAPRRRRRPSDGNGPDTSGTTKKSDVKRLKDQARIRDNADPYKRAYEAGLAGEGLPDDLAGDPDLAAVHAQGASEARRGARSAGDAAPARPARSSSGGAAQEGAGFLLGLFAYALLINYLRGGVPQVKGWLGAKFLNKPYRGASQAPPAAPAQPAQPARIIKRPDSWVVDRGYLTGEVQR